jgi:hypothetical protein
MSTKKSFLKNIRIRKSIESQEMQQQVLDPSCVGVGRFGLDVIKVVNQFSCDRQVLMIANSNRIFELALKQWKEVFAKMRTI